MELSAVFRKHIALIRIYVFEDKSLQLSICFYSFIKKKKTAAENERDASLNFGFVSANGNGRIHLLFLAIS